MSIQNYKKDFYKRSFRFKKEQRKLILKFLISNIFLKKNIVALLFFKFRKWFRFGWSSTITRNRCLWTSRPRGNFRLVRFSRITIKFFVREKIVTGIKKAVW